MRFLQYMIQLECLEGEFMDVEDDTQLSTDDKDVLLLYISSFKTSIEFMDSHLHLLDNGAGKNGTSKVAAPDWLKCAAGVVGGAIS